MTQMHAERPQDAIFQYISGLDYRRRRDFLWHEVRPRLFRFLYKFRALEPGDETSVDRMRDLLVRSQIWLSSPADFNDPFDMSAKLIAEGTLQQREQRFQQMLIRQPIPRVDRRRELRRLTAMSAAELAAYSGPR